MDELEEREIKNVRVESVLNLLTISKTFSNLSTPPTLVPPYFCTITFEELEFILRALPALPTLLLLEDNFNKPLIIIIIIINKWSKYYYFFFVVSCEF